METIGDIVTQEWIEECYDRKHIDVKIRQEIESNDFMLEKIQQGVELVNAYMAGTYYDSKNRRIAQLQGLDIEVLVKDVFVGVAYVLRPELFTSVSSQMAARLNFSDRTEAITTVAELLACLCETDAFDIEKENKRASLTLVSRIPLSDKLVEFIENSEVLPPMVCEPMKLVHNHSSGYLTHNDSLILGSGNHHDGDICLDVLNTINSVAFKLDTQFLSKVEEEPTFELNDREKVDQWTAFKKQSYQFYKLLANRTIYFTNKVDKRGRVYSQGYHLNPQGSAFKKAMLELAHEELVTGVPT